MIIGVPAESVAGERRVALIPESVKRLIAAGIDVGIEKGAPATSFRCGATPCVTRHYGYRYGESPPGPPPPSQWMS
jgi:hypothetical protein